MKTLLVSKAAGLGAGVYVSTLLASAFAGPGPQYWNSRPSPAVERAPKATAAMVCASCKTTVVQEFASTNVSGKYTPRFIAVGTKHECAACGGAITTVRGQTTSDMKANCAICAKAKAASTVCCTSGR